MAKSNKGIRLSKAARDLNVGVATLVEFLHSQGVEVEASPNTKLDADSYRLIMDEYGDQAPEVRGEKAKEPEEVPAQSIADVLSKEALGEVRERQQAASPEEVSPVADVPKLEVKVKGKIDLETKESTPTRKRRSPKAPESVEEPKQPEPKPEKVEEPAPVESVAPKDAEEKPAPAPVEAAAPEKKPVETEEAAPKAETKEEVRAEPTPREKELPKKPELRGPKVLGSIELPSIAKKISETKAKVKKAKAPVKPVAPESPKKEPTPDTLGEIVNISAGESRENQEVFRSEVEKLSGPIVVGKIDLDVLKDRTGRKPEASATPGGGVQKRKRRKKIATAGSSDSPRNARSDGAGAQAGERMRKKGKVSKKAIQRQEISKEDIEEKIKETRARIFSKRSDTLAKGVKYRKEKRSIMEAKREEATERDEAARMVLQLSEFVSVNELAGMMDVPVTDVIETCMNMGLMVSINMRLDAESLTLVADEFGYKVEFVSAEIENPNADLVDKPEDLQPRPPVFTVLGHVDHGKTTLCDTIRKSNVTAREAGGITQHLGAYSLTLPNGRKMTLIDTPGHESFTAMRARGAKLTDVAIIVVSAEDGVMPQTMEAINHASVTGARIVFAINKIDSPKANPERVKEDLANRNYLIEEWGGKYQSQEISAKKNINVDLLLEKVLLEADVMDLKANPNRPAEASVIESMVDKGRGHCANVLVQNGTLRKGDSIVSGAYFGRVKALFDDAGEEVTEAGPSTPVMVVGLNGAPQAGDSLNVVESDKEARSIASKVGHLRRVQEMRSRKHITLDEIGRRIAIGNFQELNIIVKGDVDGSVEALSDSLIQLSTDEIQVNVVHRGVGQITESDVTLAETSNAVIVGFQVRPSIAARRMADNEQIDIRLYSVIYDAIEEIKSAMEGMLSPEVKEEITGTAEVLETFRISKVGTVGGCIVREGKILRGNKAHIIRDGIVVYTNELASLKRFKDEVKEVVSGMDCGISIKGYNDIKVGDFIESFRETEVKRTL